MNVADEMHDELQRLGALFLRCRLVREHRLELLNRSNKTVGKSSGVSGPILTRLSTVTPKAIDWLWQQKIARGKITLLFGDPGGGKSTLTIDLAARLSTDSPAPDGSPLCGPASSIFITCEDGIADTILPRALVAHADVSRLLVLEGIRGVGVSGKPIERNYTIGDIDHLRTAIKAEQAALVVIDPASAYLGEKDGHRNDEIRGLLAPLSKLAEETDAAIVLVTHMSKSGGGRAMYRAMGSLAFIAAARAAWLVVKDKDNAARRLMLPVKNNIGNDRDGLAYSLVESNGYASIAWESAPITMSVDEAIASNTEDEHGKPGPEPEERDAAADWLRELLAPGELEVQQVKDEARAAGVKWRTLERAKVSLNVRSYRSQFGGAWMWRLPKNPSPPSG